MEDVVRARDLLAGNHRPAAPRPCVDVFTFASSAARIDGDGQHRCAGRGQRLRAAFERSWSVASDGGAQRRPEADDARAARHAPTANTPARRVRAARSRAPETAGTARSPDRSAAASDVVGAPSAGSRRRDAGLLERLASNRRRCLPRSTMRWLSGRFGSVCTGPLGQTIVALTMRVLLPRPKSSSFECCERNPEPALTMRVTRPTDRFRPSRARRRRRDCSSCPSAAARPTALPDAKSLRNSRSCGDERGAIRTTSASPSPS